MAIHKRGDTMTNGEFAKESVVGKFIAELPICRFNIDRIDSVPDINATIGEFDSFASHSLPLYFISNYKGINSVQFCPKVCEMTVKNFAEEQIEKFFCFFNFFLWGI